jgi:hypothetical protein
MSEERVIYTGQARMQCSDVIWCSLLSLIIIGLPLLLWRWLVARSTTHTVTNRSVRTESGVLVKTTEVLDLFRVRDIKLESFLGWETVTLISTDATTPVFRMTIHDGKRVFEQVRACLPEARQAARVATLQV